jgi:integrase
VRCHLTPALGFLPLQDLQPVQVQHFYNTLQAQGLSPRTVHYCHVLLHGALSRAEKNNLVARNVSTLVELPRMERKDMRTLTMEQVSGILLPAIAADRLFAAILLLFGTGLRRGESLALRWEDVDLQQGLIHVRQTLIRIRAYDADKRARQAG